MLLGIQAEDLSLIFYIEKVSPSDLYGIGVLPLFRTNGLIKRYQWIWLLSWNIGLLMHKLPREFMKNKCQSRAKDL